MTKHIPARSLTAGDIAQMAKEGTPFVSGKLSGFPGGNSATGEMPVPIGDQYRREAQAGRIHYTIMSYHTPIAWLRGSGDWETPEVTYSSTTSRHQQLVGRATGSF